MCCTLPKCGLSTRIQILAVLSFAVIAFIGCFGCCILPDVQSPPSEGSVITASKIQHEGGIMLNGDVYNMDITSRSIQVLWQYWGCRNFIDPEDVSNTVGLNWECGMPDVPVEFFIDGAPEPKGSYDPSLEGYDTSSSGTSVHQEMGFNTKHTIHGDFILGQDKQFYYPFDVFFFETTAAALNPDTNVSIPIIQMTVDGATNTFVPHMRTSLMTRSPARDPITGDYIVSHTIQYVLNRTLLTRVFVMVLFTVNWILTFAVLYIAASASTGMPVSEGLLILPLGVILTIPSLRALWVDGPAFGILLDVLGTFTQMVLIALASVYLLVRVALRQPKQQQSPAFRRVDSEQASLMRDLMENDTPARQRSDQTGPQQLTVGGSPV
ncbi:hypothetical protein DICSQDRAFT_177011 [Dichomitus squalens LYAD-421 SS1]|uniref:uncharacterized protein n=1 Tax=Dichomitus squalens (strain LYAD-421) TaxID=732165 RepID=UPI0004415914|nr:uncharacterized protein DICSQDRAFT_177011 [Dichomitus squalens LYAD-421 SS1]EJF67385.1 hypothetical protein DICSQDRAFT_177011 [Dichomitus squalens LYAD-421 SS1]